jgi:hypothetical protein
LRIIELYSYRGWVILISLQNSSYCFQCVCSDLEVFSDWKLYATVIAAKEAARGLVDQDDEEDSQVDQFPALVLASILQPKEELAFRGEVEDGWQREPAPLMLAETEVGGVLGVLGVLIVVCLTTYLNSWLCGRNPR